MLIRNPVRYGNGELHCAAADVTGLSGRRDIARRIQARSGRSRAANVTVGSYAKISPGEPTVPCALFLASLGQ